MKSCFSVDYINTLLQTSIWMISYSNHKTALSFYSKPHFSHRRFGQKRWSNAAFVTQSLNYTQTECPKPTTNAEPNAPPKRASSTSLWSSATAFLSVYRWINEFKRLILRFSVQFRCNSRNVIIIVWFVAACVGLYE